MTQIAEVAKAEKKDSIKVFVERQRGEIVIHRELLNQLLGATDFTHDVIDGLKVVTHGLLEKFEDTLKFMEE